MNNKITIVTFLWNDPKSRKPYTYTDKYVLTLKKQINKYLTVPYEFVCITNLDTHKIETEGIRCLPLDMKTFRSNTRYAKLQLFSSKFSEQVPGRVLYLDLDCIIVGNIDEIASRDENLILWRNPNYTKDNKRAFYNTSIIGHVTGTYPQLYDQFDNVICNNAYRMNIKGGTDQKYLSWCLGKEVPYWKGNDLIWGLGRIGDENPNTCSTVPENARIIFTPGRRTQFTKETQEKHPWIKNYI